MHLHSSAIEANLARCRVLAVALSDDGTDGAHARARQRGEVLAAPELIDPDVLSVLPAALPVAPDSALRRSC